MCIILWSVQYICEIEPICDPVNAKSTAAAAAAAAAAIATCVL